MDISIVILNYKTAGLVKQCVKGIIAAQPKAEYEIIIVDNNSGDRCLDVMQQYMTSLAHQPSTLFRQALAVPVVQYVQMPRNDGFAVGNNAGIRQARGEFILVLNPDIAIIPGIIESMVAYMHNHPGVGIVGPRLIYPDGSAQDSCRRFPRLVTPLLRRSVFGKLPQAKRLLDEYVMNDFDHKATRTVDWLFGAFLVIRRDVIDAVGMFDERFFLYFEDLDLCRRCWQAGYEVHYVADTEVVHYHQRQSAEKTGIRALFDRAGRIHLQSGFKYFAKYWGVNLPPRPHA